VAVKTPADLKSQMPSTQTPSPGKVYAAHLHDVVDTMESLTAAPVKLLTSSYSATLADSGTRFFVNSATATTITVPSNAPVGWEGYILQIGAGAVSPLPGPILSSQGHTKTSGSGAQAYFVVYENPGSAPKLALGGDTAL
jgi:hypothetical protein